MEYASKGVAGSGLGLGIAGTALGLLNGNGLGGLFGGWNGGCVAPANAACSENVLVNRYEAGLQAAIAAKDSQIALRDANTYNDQKLLEVYKYGKVRSKLLHPCYKDEKVMPVLIPNWDNTARRGNGAMVLHNATPEEFGKHCEDVFDIIKDKHQQVVFLKSWNEWGEGNYMEPCLKYGHGYIDALRKALDK